MDFSSQLKNKFETAVVNESSVFEPLKFYCISAIMSNGNKRCDFRLASADDKTLPKGVYLFYREEFAP